jgi:cation:H+ antiporter
MMGETLLTLWLEFILCAAVIVFCGYKLSIYGDMIAEKSGLGRAWIGLILMAGVTSLPELINGVSSVALAGVPDIAAGDIMGSCIFNLSIIAIMDALHGPEPVFSKADTGHILSAGFGIILIGVATMSILLGDSIPALGYVGLYTPIIVFIYFVAVRSVYFFEKRNLAERTVEMVESEEEYAHTTLRAVIVRYTVYAVFIVAAASVLPFLGEKIAVSTGLGQSFVGTFFIGITTSLPELAVSISALKIGATDMAIANLFGSNLFNIVVLAVDDLFYKAGPVLSDVSKGHAVMGLMAMLMTGITIVALIYRVRKKTFLRLSWDAIALFLAYFISLFLLYSLR